MFKGLVTTFGAARLAYFAFVVGGMIGVTVAEVLPPNSVWFVPALGMAGMLYSVIFVRPDSTGDVLKEAVGMIHRDEAQQG